MRMIDDVECIYLTMKFLSGNRLRKMTIPSLTSSSSCLTWKEAGKLPKDSKLVSRTAWSKETPVLTAGACPAASLASSVFEDAVRLEAQF